MRYVHYSMNLLKMGNKSKVIVHKLPKKGTLIKSRKVTEDGITFDSMTEHYFYKRCKELGVKVKVKPETLTLLPTFKFQGKSVRPITWTYDFYLPDYRYIVEIKGRANETFPLKEKLFFYYMETSGRTDNYAKLKNKAEIDKFLNSLTH